MDPIAKHFIIVVILVSVAAIVKCDISDVCSTYSGRRIYIDQDGSGHIHAANISTTNQKNKVWRVDRMPDGTINFHYHCQLELITCASCALHINITTQFRRTCDESDILCKCSDYMTFAEPPYEENSTETMWCGRSFDYKSRGRVLVINYVFDTSHSNPFNLSYVTEKNQLTYEGVVSQNQTFQTDILQSPFFPNFYPRDLTVDHLIECRSNDSSQCHIEISFTDFQISLTSVMEFYDEQDQLLQRYTGEIFRPPIIRLSTNMTRIRFHGNGGTGAGYRAIIKYSAKNFNDEITNTHCGGLVESFGGAITMMNMTNSSAKAFDCIWLIKPPNSYLHLKTHLLVRINTFESMASNSSVVIRDGSTSLSPVLKQYDWPYRPTNEKPFQSFVTTLSSGFYIAFNGVFAPESRFAIVYTAFSYMDCYPGPEFLCENHRCIPFFLQCDGFDHCGDGSDENERCAASEPDEAESNQYWLTHTPNYFFPKMDHYPDLKTAALVFLASAMSLIMLILLLIIILYRMNHHVREQRELQSQLRTISELLDNNANNQNEENEAAQEQPPAYEDPPDYEEASSLKLDMSIRRSSKVDTNRKRRRSRSRSRSHSQQYEQNSLLNMPASTPTPSEILIPDLFMSDQTALAEASVIECEIASRSSRRNSETVNVHSRRSSQVLLIPDSPPPEYTPRHTKIKRKSFVSTSPYPVCQTPEGDTSTGHLALVISAEQSRLIDIQESPALTSVLVDQEQPNDNHSTLPLSSRRHSFQDNSSNSDNFFEQQFAQHIQQMMSDCDWVGIHHHREYELLHTNAFSWLKNFNNKSFRYETMTQRRIKEILRKTSSENELLSQSMSNDPRLRELPAIRRSFSSGLLFNN